MENEQLIEAIKELKDSVDSLTTTNKDTFNVDTSTDDMQNLCGKMEELIKVNEFLITAVKSLAGSIIVLSDNIKRQQ